MTPREVLAVVLLVLALAVPVSAPFLLAGSPDMGPVGIGPLAWLAGVLGLGLAAAGFLLVGMAAADDPLGRPR